MSIPTNLVDAINRIRSGRAGINGTIKIGDLVVSLLTAQEGGSDKDITGRPVVSGYDTVEIVRRLPWERSLTIVLADPDLSVEAGVTAALTGSVESLTETWTDKVARLLAMDESNEIITVQTLDEVRPNCIIKSVTPRYDLDENLDCWVGQVVVKQIDVRQGGTVAGVGDALTAASKQVGVL